MGVENIKMETITLDFALLVAIVMGLSQMAKMYVQSKFVPLIALIIGVGMSYVFADFGITSAVIINGIVAALSAMGLFSGTKATVS